MVTLKSWFQNLTREGFGGAARWEKAAHYAGLLRVFRGQAAVRASDVDRTKGPIFFCAQVSRPETG